jgi:transcriptional regulator with XRE-family HTH domain
VLQTLGERIRTLRRQRRWSQKQLGAAAGLERSYINGVEHGRQNLTIGAVHRLATALEVPLEQLLRTLPPVGRKVALEALALAESRPSGPGSGDPEVGDQTSSTRTKNHGEERTSP